MPTLAKADQVARDALFGNCYRTCRVIRDIFAYVDGESVALDSFGNRHIAHQVITLIKTGDFLEEARRWRNIFADSWQDLVNDSRVVIADEKPDDRSIAELVSIYDTTNTMIRALENRLVGILLRDR